MRLLFLNHNVARRGGTFYRAYDIGRYLARRGHAVMLLTISPKRRWGFDREQIQGIEIIHTPDLLWGVGRTGWDPWDVLNRIAYLHGRAWDLIHAWDSRPAVILPALYAWRRSEGEGGKLVIDWCDWWGRGGTQDERPGRIARLLYGPVETYFEEAFRTRANGTTVISNALQERALNLGVREDTICILPQGCDLETSPVGDRFEARQRLGLSTTSPLVVTVGAVNRSDATLLFDTLRLLFQRRQDWQVFMIGEHGAQVPEDLRSSPRLTELGFVLEGRLRDFMTACDALLVPLADTVASRARWPSRVNPFLAAGRTTVITRVGDLAALLAREGGGLVTDCTPEDLVNGLIRLFETPDLQARYETRARLVARDVLAWPIIVDKLEDFYLRLFH